MNFGLMLASNRIPGTRVDLKRFTGDSEVSDKVIDRIANSIVGDQISTTMRGTLLKQFKEQAPLVIQAPESNGSAMDGPGGAMDGPNEPRRRRLQLARVEANISDPVTKVVGLILGSPDFQRQ
jgi:hypothetical protein